MNSGPVNSKSPFHVLAKPIGPICDLDCEYCFYLKKEALFPKGENFRMTEDVLEAFTRQYIEAHPPDTPEINFAWQGGEPTLMGIPFFEKAVEFQRKYARPGIRITNALQTNGVRLDDDWGKFLHDSGFLVGLSVDGPKEIHDTFRKDKRGRGTFDRVMAGLETLQRNNVEYNTLTVLNSCNSQYPKEVYEFLKASGSTFWQFIPIVEVQEDGSLSERTVNPDQFGIFLNGIFDEWVRQKDIGKIYIRDFETVLAIAMGYPSPICVHAETCGRAVAIEHNGDLFSCDHFVNREDQLGNVTQDNMAEMLDGTMQAKFGNDKRDKLPKYCLECEHLRFCNGACPKDRVALTPDGEPGLNHLCAGFKRFYSHVTPAFERMTRCLQMGRPAADFQIIDELIRQAQEQAAYFQRMRTGGAPLKPGPNAPCPCGSGRKYKKCCMVR